jgi:hypothetical protein
MNSTLHFVIFIVFLRIEVSHNSRGFSGVSWAHNFTVMLGRTRIDLLQNFEVMVSYKET